MTLPPIVTLLSPWEKKKSWLDLHQMAFHLSLLDKQSLPQGEQLLQDFVLTTGRAASHQFRMHQGILGRSALLPAVRRRRLVSARTADADRPLPLDKTQLPAVAGGSAVHSAVVLRRVAFLRSHGVPKRLLRNVDLLPAPALARGRRSPVARLGRRSVGSGF